MAMVALQVAAGVNVMATPLLNGEGWSSADKVRWKEGYLQKLGGCSRLSNQPFQGTCRGLHAWADLTGATYIGIGTNSALQLYNSGALTDITPLAETSQLSNAFSTTAGSSTVTITDTQPVNIGDLISIDNAVGVGGLLLQGPYTVTSNTPGGYTIGAGSPATTTVTAGGSSFVFSSTAGSPQIAVALERVTFPNGSPISVYFSTTVGGVVLQGTLYVTTLTNSSGTIGAGFGIGAYGAGSFGASNETFSVTTGALASSNQIALENGGKIQVRYLMAAAPDSISTTAYGSGDYGEGEFGAGAKTLGVYALRQWSLQNWGQDLLAAPTGGSLYVWTPPITEGSRATLIAQAPAKMQGMTVSAQEQICVAFGITDPTSGVQDPLLVGWCDVSNYNDWTASATNQAGNFRIPSGSKIVGMVQGPLFAAIWTDIDMWVMQYIGFPLIFSFNRVGWGCGLISMRAAGKQGEGIYWMGADNFFVYTGSSAIPVPCPVWDYVFTNLDRNYLDAVHCASNSYFGELTWYFPTIGSGGRCNAYVKFNTSANLWDTGTLERSAWIDQSAGFGPVGADYQGLLQAHETSIDLDGAPMTSSARTGWVTFSKASVPYASWIGGGTYIFLERLLPDFNISPGGSVNVMVYFADYPGEDERSYGPYTVTSQTRYLIVRGRGRYVAFEVSSNTIGTFWRLGQTQAIIGAAGAR